MGFEGFNRGFFEFFAELEVNNNRPWFQENKKRYEEVVVDPLLSFISAPIDAISEHILAVPKKTGGSMFRIYRDTRFSKDKTPYKTHAAAQFRHAAGKDVHAPGFYFHVSLESVVAGCGIWQPNSDTLGKIRQALDEHQDDWLSVRNDPTLNEHYTWAGASLKRTPRGFPVDHPLAEDLRRKDFVGFAEWPPEVLTESGLVERVSEVFRAGSPLMAFLCRALELPY